MKKLLFLFLLPLFSYGQNVQALLKFYNNSTGEEITPQVAIVEGDTLRTELHLVTVGSNDYTMMSNVKYLFLDMQYNHEILSPIENAFAFPAIDNVGDAGPIKEVYDFSNQGWVGNPDLKLSYTQWQAGDKTYNPNTTSWSVRRIAVQLSTKSFQDIIDPANGYFTTSPVFDFLSVVKAGATSNLSPVTNITLATMQRDNGSNITSLFSYGGYGFEYSVGEPVTYNAKLHFILPSTLNPTNFKVPVRVGTTAVDSTTTTFETVDITLDAAGDAILPDVELDKEYRVFNLQPIDPSYIPNVHTVTDAYRSFKYLNDVGINGTETVYNNFGLFSADANLDSTFNSGDVYGLLAYVMGVDVTINNDGGYCLPELNESGEWYHGCTAAVLYENYTIDKLGATVDINNSTSEPTEEQISGWSGAFTPTENNLNFDFAFWHHVDLDQSHSTSFPANITSKAAKVGLNLSNKAVGVTKLDMVSKIEDGKVIVELTHDGSNIVGLQARIKYDTSKLTLENIIYDTGNTITNFSKHTNGNLLFGGLSTDGSENVKRGKTFVIEFIPNGNITNTTGLFYFDNTDAVRADGEKMTLNIQ